MSAYVNSIKELIRDTVSALKGNGVPEELIEVEIRYGLMIQNKTTRRTNFVSGIPRRNYIQLMVFLENTFGKKNFTEIQTIDRIYQETENDTTERYTTVYNNEGLPIQYLRTLKRSFLKHDIPDYLMRVGIAVEETKAIQKTDEPPTAPLWMRDKKRKSLTTDNFRFDLTEVTSTAKKDSSFPHETIYEVEVELTPKNNKSKIDDEILSKFLNFGLILYKDINF